MLANNIVLGIRIICTPTVPQNIYAKYQWLVVRDYVPNPRHFKCQGFELVSSNCTKLEICGQCGLKGHINEVCKNYTKVLKCCGNHPARPFNCSRSIKKRRLFCQSCQKIKILWRCQLYKISRPAVPRKISVATIANKKGRLQLSIMPVMMS